MDHEGEQEELEGLRGCVEKFRLAKGDDVLDWNLDEYFLDGIEYRPDHRHVK